MKKGRIIEPMYVELGDWFNDHRGDVHSHEVIATRIRLIRRNRTGENRPVTREQLGGWLLRVRKYLEVERGVTLWNIPKVGYKVASPTECALYSMLILRKVVRLADRTYRLADIVEHKRIPDAFKKVFLEAEGGVKTLSARGRNFLLTWEKMRKGDDNGKKKA